MVPSDDTRTQGGTEINPTGETVLGAPVPTPAPTSDPAAPTAQADQAVPYEPQTAQDAARQLIFQGAKILGHDAVLAQLQAFDVSRGSELSEEQLPLFIAKMTAKIAAAQAEKQPEHALTKDDMKLAEELTEDDKRQLAAGNAHAHKNRFGQLLHDIGGTVEGVDKFASAELTLAWRHMQQAVHWVEEHLKL